VGDVDGTVGCEAAGAVGCGVASAGALVRIAGCAVVSDSCAWAAKDARVRAAIAKRVRCRKRQTSEKSGILNGCGK
jgi:hypothetical protein